MFAIFKFQKAAKNLPPPKVMPFKCHGCNTGFSKAGRPPKPDSSDTDGDDDDDDQ